MGDSGAASSPEEWLSSAEASPKGRTIEANTSLRRELWQQGRLLHVALWTGTTCTHFFVLYGHPNSSTDREQQAKNEILLREAFEWAAELGNVPIVVCGDFNTSVVASPTLTNTLGTQNYWDLAQLECLQKLEVEPMPTCYQQYKSKGSRIDHIFANTIFASSLISFGCVQGSGLPTHVPLRCDFHTGSTRQKGHRFRIPR